MNDQEKITKESIEEASMEAAAVEEVAETAASDSLDKACLPKKENKGITIQKSHLIIGLAVSLALVIGGFFLGYFLNAPDDDLPPESEIMSVDPMKPDPNAKPYGDVQAVPGNPDPGNIIIPGYSELRMRADTNLLKSVWLNSEGNSCYLRFTLTLADTGETIYQSGLIAPGMAVEESVLIKNLSRGEYTAIILIEAFSLSDDPIPLNSVREMSVPLYVI